MCFNEAVHGDPLEGSLIDRLMARIDKCIKECVENNKKTNDDLVARLAWLKNYKDDVKLELKKIQIDYEQDLERQQTILDKKVNEMVRIKKM